MNKLVLVAVLVAVVTGQRFDSNRPPAQPSNPIPAPSIAVPITQGRRDAICTEKNARYPVAGQCDAYIECRNWQSEEMLCPDGLRFNPKSHWKEFPCGYPIDVTCLERAALQPPRQTQDCPHQFGYYRIGDAKNCGVYRNCVSGKGYDFHCPQGLAYNSATYRCEWPDLVVDCDVEAYIGFRCPAPTLGEDGQPLWTGNLFYKNEKSCRQYFACVEGKPRLLTCEAGKAFDELTSQCEDIETVQSCFGRV